MAFYTIEKREKADGTARYRCVVGIKESGKHTHRESKTFSRQAIAKAWGIKRVAELEVDGVPPKDAGITLAELIRRYLATDMIKKGKDKKYRLAAMERSELAGTSIAKLTMRDFVDHAKHRRITVSGSTASAEMAYLKTVLDASLPFFGIPVNIAEFDAAKKYLLTMNIIHQSNKRTRRIAPEEINTFIEALHIKALNSINKTPYDDIFRFALCSCMRLGEICSLLWGDISEESRSILVRNRKDPRKKEGNHMVVPLLGDAWDIVNKQPRGGERIFPYRSQTISQVFAAVKEKTGLQDIRLHDTRREAASRLFELGFSVEEVAQVTGHKNLQTLWTVYREIYPQTLHDRFNQLTSDRTKT